MASGQEILPEFSKETACSRQTSLSFSEGLSYLLFDDEA
jgi:hypothetical protein